MGAISAKIHQAVFQPPAVDAEAMVPRDDETHTFVQLASAHEEQRISACYVDAGHDVCVLFSHGNAECLFSVLHDADEWCARWRVNVLVYDYPGYGLSSGTPSERGCYAAVEAAYNWLVQERRLAPQQVLLMGRSLGAAVCVHLAATYGSYLPFRGLVLQSPFASAFRVALETPFTVPGDMFVSVDKAPSVRAPTMIVHGELDAVVPVSHALELYAACDAAVDCLLLKHGTHSNLEVVYAKKLFRAIKHFVHVVAPQYDPDVGPDSVAHLLHERKKKEKRTKKPKRSVVSL